MHRLSPPRRLIATLVRGLVTLALALHLTLPMGTGAAAPSSELRAALALYGAEALCLETGADPGHDAAMASDCLVCAPGGVGTAPTAQAAPAPRTQPAAPGIAVAAAPPGPWRLAQGLGAQGPPALA